MHKVLCKWETHSISWSGSCLSPFLYNPAEIRELDWCNVVTCQMDTAQAYVWRHQNFVLGEHILKPRPENPTPVKACTISACGNFAILGTAGGWIERINLQSGSRKQPM